MDPSRHEKHVCFIMIQLLSALKFLQSDGIEQLSINFKEFLLAYSNTTFSPIADVDEFPRLIILQVCTVPTT
jgi:hypothetical protein